MLRNPTYRGPDKFCIWLMSFMINTPIYDLQPKIRHDNSGVSLIQLSDTYSLVRIAAQVLNSELQPKFSELGRAVS